MNAMAGHHQTAEHHLPGQRPHRHPCGPMQGGLCQEMTTCLELGAPLLATRLFAPTDDATARPAATPSATPQHDLAPPLTPPRA